VPETAPDLHARLSAPVGVGGRSSFARKSALAAVPDTETISSTHDALMPDEVEFSPIVVSGRASDANSRHVRTLRFDATQNWVIARTRKAVTTGPRHPSRRQIVRPIRANTAENALDEGDAGQDARAAASTGGALSE
jgi:hypothetical protein